jgi:hypothetical protein
MLLTKNECCWLKTGGVGSDSRKRVDLVEKMGGGSRNVELVENGR